MTQSKSFSGETTDRREAFPDIISLELHVTQDRFGRYTSRPSQRERRYTLKTFPPHLSCANPRCQQGGLDLQKIVESWPSGSHKFRCNGHEGTPKGRRKGGPCGNSFEVTLSVERRDTFSDR